MRASTPSTVTGPLAVLALVVLLPPPGSLRAAPAEESAPKQPNIVFILADDHATQAISAYRSQINQTPNIDRLPCQGVRFTNRFAINDLHLYWGRPDNATMKRWCSQNTPLKATCDPRDHILH